MLPNIFKPKHLYKLIRLGSNHDGGYLVGYNSIFKSKFLISFGIEANWDFEKQFQKKNNKVKTICYDVQTNFKFFLKNILTSFVLIKWNLMFFYIKQLLKYPFFFHKNKLINKFISQNKDLDQIIEDKNNVFIKIDIEGSEYRILESLIKNNKKINGLVIEFHDVDLHLEKIISFIKKINLDLVHIHANNYIYDSDNWKKNYICPPYLELTFEKNPEIENRTYIHPHRFDQPNDKYSKEINLEFNTN